MAKAKRPAKKNRGDEKRAEAMRSLVKAGLNLFAKGVAAAAIVALTAYGAHAGYEAVAARGHFKIDKVVLEGNEVVSKGIIKELLDLAGGESILKFDLAGTGKRLESHPWIESVSVKRELPSTIRLIVAERKPVAVIELDKNYLLDAYGVILSEAPAGRKFPFPWITGLTGYPKGIKPGATLEPGSVDDAIYAIKKMEGYLLFGSNSLSGVSLARRGELVMSFGGSSVEVTAPRGRWTDEPERLRTVDYILRGKEAAVKNINLNFVNKVIVTYPTMDEAKRG